MTPLKGRSDVPLPAGVAGYLDRVGLSGDRARVVPLTGDASDRRYFRAVKNDGQSIVLALHSAPFVLDALPFVNVARLFSNVPLPVPAILGHADDLGVLVVQDLGDVTLQAHLGAASPGEHAALYRQAIGLLDALQRRGRELESEQYVPYRVAFDVEKLTWELEFFVRHFIEAYRGVSIPPAARAAIVEEWAPIVRELASEPRVLCHRDYHSRNLMLHDGRLFMIDFQDARMGPDTYDLASLLRDSYVDIGEDSVEEFIAYFLALKGLPPEGREAGEFRRRFDLMALQRNLKALGTFGYQTATRQNPVYIQYIPRYAALCCDQSRQVPRWARLRDLLSSYVEEFR